MKVEVCANGLQSALNAQRGGAHRIELCVDLSVGGLSPSEAIIRQVMQHISIPVNVLLRPRAGNFCYNDQELEAIYRGIELCKDLCCAGVVSGALDSTGNLNAEAVGEMIRRSGHLEFTFHRAIDVTQSPMDILDELIEMGATRILTSGGQPTAIDGIGLLSKLKERAAGRISIMPGGGINSDNVRSFLDHGFDAIHLSAIKKPASKTLFDNPVQGVSDVEEIQKVVELLS